MFGWHMCRQGTGVPIVVPHSCNQYVLAKLNTLFFITISKMFRKRLEGKLAGKFLSFKCRKFVMDAKPVAMSMHAYIDLASAVKTRAISRMLRFLRFWMSMAESLRYDFIKGSSSLAL